jgi:hippurate hydrolase
MSFDFSCDSKMLVKDYEYLHSIPEVGFELSKTKEYVKKRLFEMGIEPFECGKCGLGALIGEGDKTLLLRADMDALPMEDGYKHACGHDMHTAMLLSCADILRKNESVLKTRVKLMFQSAEEILEGAKDMIENGILKNPKPDGAFMLHVAAATDYPTGTVIFGKPGETAPAADYFEIEIKGIGCHGSKPDAGIDPINAAAHVITAVQTINSRELGIFDSAVITIGSVHAGNSPNVIPDKVSLQGTMRAYNQNTREFVKERLAEITKGVCQTLRCECDFKFTRGCPPFQNDEALLNKVCDLAGLFLGEDRVVTYDMLPQNIRGGGSEDFSFVSRLVPTAMASLCAGSIKDGYKYPLHHPDVSFDKDALSYGSSLMAYIAFNF